MSIVAKLRQTAREITPVYDDHGCYELHLADLRDLLDDAAARIEELEKREKRRGVGINNTPAVFLNTSGEQIT